MRPAWMAALLGLACSWGGDRPAEEAYARQVTDALRAFEKVHRLTSEACNRGPVDCAVAANNGVDVAKRSRARLAAATPPAKLRDAHEKLLLGLDHLAEAYQEIANTYWNRSDLYSAYKRSVRSMEKAILEVGDAGVSIGFKGDSAVWAKR